MKTSKRLQDYEDQGQKLTIVRSDGTNVTSSHSTVPATTSSATLADKNFRIDNLVVATKLYQTEAALTPYIPYLSPSSNILLLQNGMGMPAFLTERFWPGISDRPNIFHAISTHGAYKTSPNVVHHASQGKLSISYIPKITEKPDISVEIPQFIDLILQTKALDASYLEYKPFLLAQMEKLVVNSCINPLTALLDCYNGDLLYGTKVVPMMKRVILESIEVFFAEYKALEDISEARIFLNPDRLLKSVLSVCKLTASNSSSMREDVKHLNKTEIDWINGYIVALGHKHKIATPTNKMLVNMVKNKLSIDRAVDENAASLAIES